MDAELELLFGQPSVDDGQFDYQGEITNEITNEIDTLILNSLRPIDTCKPARTAYKFIEIATDADILKYAIYTRRKK